MSTACPPPPVYVLGALDARQDAAHHISQLFEQGGLGTKVFLQPATEYHLKSPIVLSHDGQELATVDYPEHDEWKATLLTVGPQADAIVALNRSFVRVCNLIVDGQEPRLGSSEKREPLILIGGPQSHRPTVQDCVLRHPRGWTCLHVADFAVGAKVVRNHVGPAGHPAPAGPWADGISFASRDGVVSGNTVVDSTDGAIVLFCAPGTVVSDNTIIARSRDGLGGINLVDAAPFDADYTNTRVIGNRIYSQGAYIKLGIGCGPLAWGDWEAVGAKGGFVEDNAILSGRLGYGFAAAGCTGMTFRGNRVSPQVSFEGNTHKTPWNIAPAPFVRLNNDELAEGDFQPDFQRGFIKFLIGVSPEPASQARFYPGKILGADKACIQLKHAALSIKHDGALHLTANQDGRVLWSANSARVSVNDAELHLSEDGHLQIRSQAVGQVLWDPIQTLPCAAQPKCDGSWLRDATFIVRDHQPYLSIQDAYDNVIFSTDYSFPLNWSMDGAHFVAVPHTYQTPDQAQVYPSSSPLPPAVPPRPGSDLPKFTWLYLCPTTSQMILHTSPLPNAVEPSCELWRSQNWHMPPPEEGDKPTKLALQGPDGMMVIYRDGQAVWASGSTQATHLRLTGAHQPGGARAELIDEAGQVKWRSGQ